MGLIVNMTRNTMKDALIGYSQKLKVQPSDVKIMIKSYDEEQLPEYYITAKSKEGELDEFGNKLYPLKVRFQDLIFAKLDFFNKAETAPPFIKDALNRISKDYQLVGSDCKATDLDVVIYSKNADNDITPCMYLFKNGKPIQEITFDYLIEGDN